MPLTIDLLTLTWLKVRASLWLGRRRGSLSLLFLASLASCVPATRFEEAQSAAQVEMEGRRRAEHELALAKAQNEQLAAQMRGQTSDLDQRAEALAQAELDTTTQGKQRQDAEGLVEQLRAELGRAGEHLRSFHDDKQRLEASRSAETSRSLLMVRVARDLSLLLPEPIAAGDLVLDAEPGRLVLRGARAKLLADDGAVKPEAEPLLKALAHVLGLHPGLRITVTDTTNESDPVATTRIVDGLMQRGVTSSRFEARSEAGGAPQPEVAAGEPTPSSAGQAAPSSAGPAGEARLDFALLVP
jgi:flagellar motor protein MotB